MPYASEVGNARACDWGRNYNDAALVMRILCDLKPTVVIVGDATGPTALRGLGALAVRVPVQPLLCGLEHLRQVGWADPQPTHAR